MKLVNHRVALHVDPISCARRPEIPQFIKLRIAPICGRSQPVKYANKTFKNSDKPELSQIKSVRYPPQKASLVSGANIVDEVDIPIKRMPVRY